MLVHDVSSPALVWASQKVEVEPSNTLSATPFKVFEPVIVKLVVTVSVSIALTPAGPLGPVAPTSPVKVTFQEL